MDSIDPEAYRGDKAECGEEVSGEFVVSGSDAAEIFEATECALDDVAEPVELGIEREGDLAVSLVGNDGRCALAFEEEAQMRGVVAFVADHDGRSRSRGQKRGPSFDV